MSFSPNLDRINTYKSAEEAMIVRGLHMNVIIDKINEINIFKSSPQQHSNRVTIASYRPSTEGDAGLMRGIHLRELINKINEVITTDGLATSLLDFGIIRNNKFRTNDDVVPVRKVTLRDIIQETDWLSGSFSWSLYWSTRFADNLVATTISDVRIDLSWDNNGPIDYDGISIERSDNGGSIYIEIDTIAVGETSYSDTGLTANTTYYYRIRYFKL